MKSQSQSRDSIDSNRRSAGKWEIATVVLAGFALLVGGLSGWLIRGIDQEYSALISEGIPLLNDLQTATRRNADVYALKLESASTREPAARMRLENEVNQSLAKNSVLIAEAAQVVQAGQLQGSYARLMQRQQAFLEAMSGFDRLLDSGAAAETLLTFNRQTFAPAFLAYQKQLDVFCDDCQAYYLKRSDSLTSHSVRHGRFLLVFSFAPLALCVLAVLIALGLVLRLVWRYLFSPAES